ncbi:Branched-chain amino acid transport system / permease component [Caprobacter fermentans]|uniref:Branched-chain amino acid transport system / permease component n=2 Tax=Caproicibacter fermentans TaxID=2576756 RepID=A0A6N8I3B7_9FIRM|nr:Branched-chain amino acid transport system / permease component [Caproicibacter fermentans]
MKYKIMKQLLRLMKTFSFPFLMYAVILLVSLGAQKTGYWSGNAFDIIIRGSVVSTIIAFAIALPLSGARWDFAAGTIVILSGILGSNLASMLGLNAVLMLLLTVAIGTLLAMLEGVLYLFLRVPTIIVSLGVVMIYEALSGLVFDGSGANMFMDTKLTIFAKAPYCYLILAIVLGVYYFLLTDTKFGYDTRSLGINAQLAVNNGVNEKKNIIQTYLLVGATLGVAAVLNASTVSVSPASNLGSTSIMFSSMGPVLVGLYLARFSNLPLGIFSGAIGMNALTYGMVVLGIDGSVQTIILGAFIVIFMGYTTNQEKLHAFSQRMFHRSGIVSA